MQRFLALPVKFFNHEMRESHEKNNAIMQ